MLVTVHELLCYSGGKIRQWEMLPGGKGYWLLKRHFYKCNFIAVSVVGVFSSLVSHYFYTKIAL